MPCSIRIYRLILTLVIGAWKGRFVLAVRSISETKRVRYLLGLSSPAERENIESEYFEDEGAFQEMLTAEDDLIDAYARGELAGEERQRFERKFVSSLRRRVQFARAFMSNEFATRSVERKLPGTLHDILKTFQSPRLLRTSTIAAVIVFVMVLGWLVIDRRRITNELRELRAESAELSKRTEALQRGTDTERTHTAEIAAQPVALRIQPDKLRHREAGTPPTTRGRNLPEVKNALETIASSKPEHAEKLINREDATLGSTFVNKQITQLPLEAPNVPNLLTLQTATTRDGYVAGERSDQANTTLHGVDVQPLNTYSLMPRNTSNSGETTIRIPSSLSWIRFHIALETAAIHEDYRATIKTAEGRPVALINWSEPVTPSQTIVDAPVIPTGDLPSGDYVLLLMGKVPDGSFVKVAEYSFKVIKY